MSASFQTLVVAVCTFGGAMLGMRLAAALPKHHLTSESKDTVKVAMGLIATMTALVLGLVTASAKSGFDADSAAVKNVATSIMMLDRALARYGPETAEIRRDVRSSVTSRLDATWPQDGGRAAQFGTDGTDAGRKTVEGVEDLISTLSTDTDAHARFRAQALDLTHEIRRMRWQVVEDIDNPDAGIPRPFLVTLVCWLTVIFVSFGMLAPRNATTVVALLFSALSVAAAVLLILEMATPFDGLMKVSPGPLKYALSQLGR